MLEYLKSHALKDPEEYARDKTIALSELAGSSDVETLSDIGLLTQAGYLTIKSVEFGNTVFLVAEENNRIIGYIGMYLAMDEGEITNVAVAPVERCHGVGGMLLTELLKIAENKGVARIVLEVRASNDSAIRLYERNGFVQCGMRKGFYEFPKEDAYVMVHGH